MKLGVGVGLVKNILGGGGSREPPNRCKNVFAGACDHFQQVRAQKVTCKNVFAWACDHFQQVRAQKVTRTNVFAGAWDHFQQVRAQKVTRTNAFAGACGHFQQVRAQKVMRKNVFAGGLWWPGGRGLSAPPPLPNEFSPSHGCVGTHAMEFFSQSSSRRRVHPFPLLSPLRAPQKIPQGNKYILQREQIVGPSLLHKPLHLNPLTHLKQA